MRNSKFVIFGHDFILKSDKERNLPFKSLQVKLSKESSHESKEDFASFVSCQLSLLI